MRCRAPRRSVAARGNLAQCRFRPFPPEIRRARLHQYNDDEQVDAAAISSARWAYMLFRAPVMVAVHADEMLGSGPDHDGFQLQSDSTRPGTRRARGGAGRAAHALDKREARRGNWRN